jgi:hypothetical protein
MTDTFKQSNSLLELMAYTPIYVTELFLNLGINFTFS